ncbi:hypothetical protein [Kitasatospora nipponensis]|uniref:hypothetical protein n=1 Tax=Kitasatospora nipponensis TaxID=258049 RepID=UPI0031D38291
MTRLACAALSVLVAVLATGCSAAQTRSTAQPTSACRQPPEAVLPRTAGTLTEADSGVFCLPVGSRLAVFLTPPPADTTSAGRWSTVLSSSPPVLADAGTGVLTAPVGVTPGIFQGASAGRARLTSGTLDGGTWQVTVVVS